MREGEKLGLFQDITDEGLWREFLSRKREQGCLSRREEKDLAEYVENREYLQEAERIRSGKAFPLPVKHLISKTLPVSQGLRLSAEAGGMEDVPVRWDFCG